MANKTNETKDVAKEIPQEGIEVVEGVYQLRGPLHTLIVERYADAKAKDKPSKADLAFLAQVDALQGAGTLPTVAVAEGLTSEQQVADVPASPNASFPAPSVNPTPTPTVTE